MTSPLLGAPTFKQKCGDQLPKKKAPYKSIGIQAAAAFDPAVVDQPAPIETAYLERARFGIGIQDQSGRAEVMIRPGSSERVDTPQRWRAEFDGSETQPSKRTLRDDCAMFGAGSTYLIQRLTIHSTIDPALCTHRVGRKTRRVCGA